MAKDYSALIEALESGAMAPDEMDSMLEQNPQLSNQMISKTILLMTVLF